MTDPVEAPSPKEKIADGAAQEENSEEGKVASTSVDNDVDVLEAATAAAAIPSSKDNEEDLHDVDIENNDAANNHTPRSSMSSQHGRNSERRASAPTPKRKPLWLHVSIILALIALIGSITITVVSAKRGELSKLALGFLIFFALVLVCIVPIICYTRANFFANGLIH